MKSAATDSLTVSRGLEMAAGGFGMLGQFYDLQAAGAEHVKAMLHLLFGVTLCAAIVWRYRPLLCVAAQCTAHRAIDHCAVVRLLSRRVYLLLYGLAGFRELVMVVQGEHALHSPPPASVLYLCYGLLGLALIRLLAMMGRWRDRGATSRAVGYRFATWLTY